MRFLLDANKPRSAVESVRRLGREGLDVRDFGLGGVDDKQIAAHAKEHGLARITRDFDFSDVRNYPPAEFGGIIVLGLLDDAVAARNQVKSGCSSLMSRSAFKLLGTWLLEHTLPSLSPRFAY